MVIRPGVLAAMAVLLAGAAAPLAAADPYPDITGYRKLDYTGFQVEDNPGVWFSTPSGLNCGIWTDGSFGCDGSFPGVPHGMNQIAWFDGDPGAHLDGTGEAAFSAGAPTRALPAGSYVLYRGARCAMTPDRSVYCINSYLHDFMVSPDATWIEGQRQ